LPKLGVIGLGKMGLLHSSIHSALEGELLTAACEKDGLIAKIARKAIPHLKIYNDYATMVSKESLDAVIIATPVQTHANIILDLVSSNSEINIFVEKPLAANHEEARKICEAIGNTNAVYMVGLQKRFAVTFSKGKEFLTNEEIGRPLFFSGHIFSSDVFREGEGWRLSKGSGGVAVDLGPHVADLVLWYFGQPSKVTSLCKSLYSSVEDYASATLEFQNGLFGNIEMSWSIRNYRLPELYLEVHGSNGVLTVSDDFVKLQLDDAGINLPAGVHMFRRPELQPSVPFLLAEPEFTLEDIAFRSALSNRKATEPDFLAGARVNELIDVILGR
jgi:predicted dehydrogenase